MSVTMYLLYDGELKFAMEDDSSQFETLTETSVFTCNIGDQINWMVSSYDTQLEKIQIKDKKKIAGKKPTKGNWKDTWEEKPKSVSKTHCQGIPDCSGATKEDPQVFAFEITYKIKGSKGEISIDPAVWSPPPAPQPAF